MSETTVFCLTPVRNEAWILEQFLTATSLWADRIVIADQGSTDGSQEIAAAHPKVTLVENRSLDYSELERQELLVRTARELADGRRVLIALDADEVLTTRDRDSETWTRALEAPLGTALRWRWANVLPGGTDAWVPPAWTTFGVVDDGREHSGTHIHNVRIPVAQDAPTIDFAESVVLHLQYVDWARMKSKQAWYQCWETLHDPLQRAAVLYRKYHHMDEIPKEWIRPLDPASIDACVQSGIGLRRPHVDGATWWDAEILDWLHEHGPGRFSKLDLWSTDWAERARALNRDVVPEDIVDPRSNLERAVGRWLALTQRRARSRWVRLVDRGLRLVGW